MSIQSLFCNKFQKGMQIYRPFLLLLLFLGTCLGHEGSPLRQRHAAVSKISSMKSESLNKRRLPAKAVSCSSIVAKESNAKVNVGPTEEMDFIQVNLLMFFFYLTLGSAMPYIPMYYRALAIPDAEIGYLGAIAPATNFLVSPLWGAFADSTSLHIEIMVITFVLSVISRFTLFYANHWPNVFVIATVVCLIAVLNAPVKPLMDGEVMKMLPEKQKSAYGKSRLFGQIGFGLGSYIVGKCGFVDSANIRYMFVVHVLLAIPTAILMCTFSKQRSLLRSTLNQPSVSIATRGSSASTISKEGKGGAGRIKDALVAIKNDPKLLVFFLMVYLIGVSSGVIENFAYVRLSEVGGTDGNVLGTLRFLTSIAGGPMFWLSGRISKAIGINGILMLSLLSYTLRFFIYANINNPSLVLVQAVPAELLRALVFAPFWAGSTFFVFSVSPPGTTATMLAILNAVYGGLGQSTGSLLGGQIIKYYGSIQNAFTRCGYVDAIILASFVVYNIAMTFRTKVGTKNSTSFRKMKV